MTVKDASSFNGFNKDWLRKVIEGRLKKTDYPLFKGFYWYKGIDLPEIYKTQKDFNVHFIKGKTRREKLKNEIRELEIQDVAMIYGESCETITEWCKIMHLPSKSSEIKLYSDEEWESI